MRARETSVDRARQQQAVAVAAGGPAQVDSLDESMEQDVASGQNHQRIAHLDLRVPEFEPDYGGPSVLLLDGLIGEVLYLNSQCLGMREEPRSSPADRTRFTLNFQAAGAPPPSLPA